MGARWDRFGGALTESAPTGTGGDRFEYDPSAFPRTMTSAGDDLSPTYGWKPVPPGKALGYVTDPLRRANAIVILRVEDHQKEGQAAFDEVENEINERLATPRFQPKIREYLTQLRKEAFLEIKDGYVDTGAAAGKDTKWVDPAQLKPETVTKEEVAGRKHKKKLLWAVPIPGTGKSSKQEVSSSK